MLDGSKQFLFEMREEVRCLPNSVPKFSLNLINSYLNKRLVPWCIAVEDIAFSQLKVFKINQTDDPSEALRMTCA